MDGTNPEAQAWLERVFRTYRKKYGIRYFKLDANYWGAIHGGHHHDSNATRIEAYRRGMAAVIRGAGPGAIILGCNAPVWPSLGLVNVMRTSMDINRTFNSQKNIARENFMRGWQNGRLWVLYSDCLMIAGEFEKKKLPPTPEMRIFRASVIHASGGMMISGDRTDQLNDPDSAAIMRKQLPVTGVSAAFDDFTFSHGVSQVGAKRYHYLFNWTDQPADRSFDVGAAASCTDFWTGQDLGRQTGMLKLPPLPPRSARIIVCE